MTAFSHRYNDTKSGGSQAEINEIIDIILQKAIILVPVINDEHRLIGVVGRLDILKRVYMKPIDG
ncbi:MAG: CBS domain-containing protein [Candidatus Nitrosopolaris sp.]